MHFAIYCENINLVSLCDLWTVAHLNVHSVVKKGINYYRKRHDGTHFTSTELKVEMTQALPVIQMTSRRAVLEAPPPPAALGFRTARSEGGQSRRKSLPSQGNTFELARSMTRLLCVSWPQRLDKILISNVRASESCQSTRNWKCAAHFRIDYCSLRVCSDGKVGKALFRKAYRPLNGSY